MTWQKLSLSGRAPLLAGCGISRRATLYAAETAEKEINRPGLATGTDAFAIFTLASTPLNWRMRELKELMARKAL